jgi:hypothetical protein
VAICISPNNAICRIYTQGLTLADFWSSHGSACSCFLERGDIDRILKCTTRLQDVAKELSAVTSSTLLGARMFEQVYKEYQKEQMSEEVSDLLASIPAKVEANILRTLSRSLSRKANELNMGKTEPYTFVCSYRGLELQLSAASPAEELVLRASCMLKAVNVLNHIVCMVYTIVESSMCT